jgi:hypothetical protein
MVDSGLFDHLTDGIVKGLSRTGFCMGDGLEYDEGSSDEDDGTYVVRAFYYDAATELQHTILINVTVEVESVEHEDDDDDEDDDE